ncbi:MAG: substrate-binding domain-containing protein, partial [Pseudomonadota bacterium]|nr:substrate-binding domain-containing protein [Pseudomonadota bacterium]
VAPLDWKQLDRIPFIQLDCTGATRVVNQCRAAGFTAEPDRTLANDTSIVAMVGRGLGYSILPRLAILPDSAEVQVMELPVATRRHLVLIALPDTSRLPAVKIVRRFFRHRDNVAKTSAFRAGLIRLD